ncbi:MAG: hypothetical protein JXB42_03820 [Deltaproteobacteria bacterium]|nr:hypothetical protein [Deltaproteobacteria bacterium]
METFALAVISLAIAIPMITRKKKNSTFISFACLCLAIFLMKSGAFFSGIFENEFWRILYRTGLLSIPPVLITFLRYAAYHKTLLSNRIARLTTISSCVVLVALFTPLYQWRYLDTALFLYIGCAIIYCLTSLVLSISERTTETEKTRLTNMLIACVIASILSISDIIHHYTPGVPPLSDIAIAALLYFIFLVITHPELPELYEILLRSLMLFSIMLFATLVFYLVMGLFERDLHLPFNSVIMSAFIIVIFIDPVKQLLKRVFKYMFPKYREIDFLDEEVERGKAALLEEMATGLAHEIRNPLGSIKGAAQYLKSEEDGDRNGKLLDVIIEETDRLDGVMSRFLNYANPYSVNADIQDINRIVEKVIALLKTTPIPDNTVIDKSLDYDIPKIRVDGEQIMQVLMNVGLNGLEAMPGGGRLSFATAKIMGDGDRSVEIIIRDTGYGVNRKDLSGIFKPFFTTKPKGTGLGLSICSRIIRNHGGRIDVESEPGRGTAFFIRL